MRYQSDGSLGSCLEVVELETPLSTPTKEDPFLFLIKDTQT